ncbi:phosphoribosyltransferase family protein [Streptomyces sp. 15-116A]|uniref:phosphoribosyltransferase n=1 Tax=Streptomyces sp. 15-116A TaxID=2259035 RepID=UPI0021B323B1|nr:phosphoribosyltransferase family protein [Streptomyces sp. 15-116A]MCT7357314.1 phosphoribosyltransferase family protein [Streptomyces sp. 15-116A]
MRFHDRRQAGEQLALRLMEWAADGDLRDAVGLALPRGGVPVAAEVARALKVPLDVLVARKIPVPGIRETGIGANRRRGPSGVRPARAGDARPQRGPARLGRGRERTELHRRQQVYRGGRPAPRVTGRTVVLVDDGLAIGGTARAALRHLRRQDPARLILAVPVCAPATAEPLREEADDLMCLHQPQGFHAVSEWYEDFAQVGDEEVRQTLREPSPAA